MEQEDKQAIAVVSEFTCERKLHNHNIRIVKPNGEVSKAKLLELCAKFGVEPQTRYPDTMAFLAKTINRKSNEFFYNYSDVELKEFLGEYLTDDQIREIRVIANSSENGYLEVECSGKVLKFKVVSNRILVEKDFILRFFWQEYFGIENIKLVDAAINYLKANPYFSNITAAESSYTLCGALIETFYRTVNNYNNATRNSEKWEYLQYLTMFLPINRIQDITAYAGSNTRFTEVACTCDREFDVNYFDFGTGKYVFRGFRYELISAYEKFNIDTEHSCGIPYAAIKDLELED